MIGAEVAREAPGLRQVLTVRGLRVAYPSPSGPVQAVDGVDLELGSGEVLAVVGESGSGKSTLALSLLGLLPSSAAVTGSVTVGDVDLVGADPRQLRSVRGERVAMVFQEPGAALNPVLSVSAQLVETIRAHRRTSRRRATDRAAELLRLVEIDDPERILRSFPFQLSGGQQQRVMLAMALALEPEVLVADEPTTALDVTVQAEISALLRAVSARQGVGLLLITHDLGLVADLADRVMVLEEGRVVESAGCEELYTDPRAPYTQRLLRAVPRLPESWTASSEVHAESPGAEGDTGGSDASIVCVERLVVRYPGGGRDPDTLAVNDVDLQVGAGRTVALVGESGSGKTTIGRALIGLAPITSGRVRVAGHDLSSGDARALALARPRVGVVFQDPGSSLDPRWSVSRAVAQPLEQHRTLGRSGLRARIRELLDDVQLPARLLDAYPHELSGGQRQRVGIARALALDPDFVLADEPTSALDVSVQSVVLSLFADLQSRRRFGCLFITHDLAVVAQVAQQVVVLRSGAVIESGSVEAVLGDPQDVYTRTLLQSVPVPDPSVQRRRAR